MTKEWLSDISKRPNFKEITAKGGRSRSKKKQLALAITGSQKQKCKNCKLSCYFKQRQIQNDSEARCICPELRLRAIKNGTAIEVLSQDFIDSFLSEVIIYFKEKWNNTTDSKEREILANSFISKLSTIKREWFPALQKTAQVELIKVQLVTEKTPEIALEKARERFIENEA